MSENNGLTMVERNPDGTIKKGSVLNPKGNPGARHMTTILREAIAKVSDGAGDSDDLLIVKRTIEDAKNGDQNARKLIWNYMDGMPVQGINLGGDPDNPIEHSVTVKWK